MLSWSLLILKNIGDKNCSCVVFLSVVMSSKVIIVGIGIKKVYCSVEVLWCVFRYSFILEKYIFLYILVFVL